MSTLLRRIFVFAISSSLLIACQQQVNQVVNNSEQTTTNAISDTDTKVDTGIDPPTNTVAVYDGSYEGTVQRRYDIQFTVEDSEVRDVKANVIEQCSDSSTTNVTTVYFEGQSRTNLTKNSCEMSARSSLKDKTNNKSNQIVRERKPATQSSSFIKYRQITPTI